MDKKRQMMFNLNNFLLAFSEVLHTKKIAYISLNLGLSFAFDAKKLADLCSYSLISNLVKEDILLFDFLDKKHIEDKVFLKIVEFSKTLCEEFSKDFLKQKLQIINFIEKICDEEIKNKFLDLVKSSSFFLDLDDENEILRFIYSNLSDFTKVLDFEEILKMSEVLHKYENKDSHILVYAEKLTTYFDFEHKDKYIFLLATSLSNIGKLAIPKEILYKKEDLNQNELELVRAYSYHTRRILNSIMAFSDIANLASKVQEKLDGSGIFLLCAKDLSFKDRLLICLLIYNALREEKVYRKAFSHNEAIKLMKEEAKASKIDSSIVNIFEELFS